MSLVDYPWSIFRAALASTLGALVTLALVLSSATAAGFFALFFDMPDLSEPWSWVLLLVGFIFPIIVACIQLWGFLYLFVMGCFLHYLLFEDGSRWRAVGAMLLPQFICTVLALNPFRDEEMDWPTLLRILSIGLLLSLGFLPSIFHWRRNRALAAAAGDLVGGRSRGAAKSAKREELK